MLLSVEEFRLLVPSPSIEDEGLQLLLDASEQAITARYGEIGSPVTELVDGGYTYFFLRRRASSIDTVVETISGTDTTLAEDDFRIRGDGVSVRRLPAGTNDRLYWGDTISVTYTPADDEADRKRVQMELMKLDLSYEPGMTAEQIGSWLEQRANNSTWNAMLEREAILDSLIGGQAVPGFA